jgi:hypothetical protein
LARIGFCNGFYTSQSPTADCEVAVNWYPESIESGMGQSAMALYPTPGLGLFVTLPGMVQVRTGFEFAGRKFWVAQDLFNQYLWETPNGVAATNYGKLGVANGASSFAANNANQLMVCSSGLLFLFALTTNVLAEIDTSSGTVVIGPVAQIAFSDGFFVALIASSQTIQVSSLLNGAASGWSPLNFTIVSVFPDQVLSMLVDHREVWFWGSKQTIPYFDAGAPIFPYLPVPGGFIEQGIIAPASPVKLDNSVMWIGGDERGAGVAWRANGYLPTRISTHAIEYQWQNYPTMKDAIGYSFQYLGHSYAHWYFPSANKSWRYDVATGLWHQPASGVGGLQAHLSQCHIFDGVQHLVGDRSSGNIYVMSNAYLTDNGNPIQRIRRGPPVSSEQEYMFLHKFQLFIESGLGPDPPLTDAEGNPRGPQFYFRLSKDGGHTWTDPVVMDAGQSGDFTRRLLIRRMGRARSVIFEVSTTDPFAARIIDAYLDAPGYDQQQRLPKKLAAMA